MKGFKEDIFQGKSKSDDWKYGFDVPQLACQALEGEKKKTKFLARNDNFRNSLSSKPCEFRHAVNGFTFIEKRSFYIRKMKILYIYSGWE